MTDYYGCKHDADTEQADLAARAAHEAGECKGAPVCGECLDAQEKPMKKRKRICIYCGHKVRGPNDGVPICRPYCKD